MSIVVPSRSLGRPVFLIGMFLAAFSTLSLELVLTRLFSVTMYYHFAFMVVSLALLGLGVAGVTIYLVPRLINKAPGITAAVFMLVFVVLPWLTAQGCSACLPPVDSLPSLDSHCVQNQLGRH